MNSDADNITALFGTETVRVYPHTIAVWIPGMRSDKIPLDQQEIDQWVNRFLVLFSLLFGGGTAFGVRKAELCSVLAQVSLEANENEIFTSLGTIEGGYVPNIDDPSFNKIRSQVLEPNARLSAELMGSLAHQAVDREPVSVVEAYVEESRWTRESQAAVIRLAKKMGEDTLQHEIGIRLDKIFYSVRTSSDE